MLLHDLRSKNLIQPPSWLDDNTQYLTMMGSVAYGVSDDTSDMDTYGFCIPPKDIVFPHLAGEILGFGRQIKRFDQWQQHHIKDNNKMYDFSVYSIVRYFQLVMENNPNMIDSLFTRQSCVIHCSRIGNMVRDKRCEFLHKGSWHKFKGYTYSQLHKMNTKNPEGKRKEIRDRHGFDTKFAYHVVRLLYEAEMILQECDIDLMRYREHLKAIRKGEVKEQDIREWASDKEKSLEKLYHESSLRYSPNEQSIKQLLLDCLEQHYGSISGCVENPDRFKIAVSQIKEIVDKV